MMTTFNLQQAYQFCQDLAQSHYENFPVASILLPKKLRRPISVIYAFARTADDFADEGDATIEQRLQSLDDYSTSINQIKNQQYQGNDPIFIALGNVISQHDLSISLFDDLLSAFKQDVIKSRYDNFEQVVDYCARSANPVGRLLLQLNGEPSPLQLQQSDAICTALQLINFYQDIQQDLTESDRIYIPLDELKHYQVSEQQLLNSDSSDIAPLIRFQYQRALNLMSCGLSLGSSLNGRLGWEIRAMTLGGIATLYKLINQSDHALLERPRLSKLTLIKIMISSSCKSTYHSYSQKIIADSS